MRQDDLTAKARIRDAAIAVVVEQGATGLTARRVAKRAGVSPGLVTHHYGSMEGLQEACDHHVAALVREAKRDAMAQGAGLDPLGAVRASQATTVIGYLARRLSGDAPAVAGLVDEMVDDAADYLAEGEASGMVRPTDDPRARAAIVVIWSLGALVLHDHLHRLLGVDLTDPDLQDGPDFLRYARPAMEAFGRGLLTPEVAERLLEQFAAAAPDAGARPAAGSARDAGSRPDPTPDPHPTSADRHPTGGQERTRT